MPPARLPAAVLLVCLLVLAPAAPASAQMFVTTGKDTLRHLPGIEVIVDPVPDALEQRGISAATLRRAIEERLQAAGVPIFANQQANPSDAKPYLYVHLNGFEIPGASLYAVNVQVQVRQTVRSVVTSSNIVDAMTWDSHTVLGVPATELREVTADVLAHVDRFARDWKATR